jgi:2-polyprenyl-6-methoxyphenol hydroxylase-like FAD-dependent oxidoreductase
MRAVVVGAGIGGLGAALALQQRGHDVIVLERAKELEAVGAGIALARNGLRALEQLGVGEGIAAAGATAGRVQLRTKEGDVLLEVPLHERGWEMLGTHRADLQTALVDAVGPERIRLGEPCVGFEDNGASVRVHVDGGDTETADVLVGADGIRSIVRASLHGDEPPRYAGYVGWRTVIDFEHELLSDVFTESWGCGERFGLVRIGGGRLYWFVSESALEPSGQLRGSRDDFLRRFGDWHDPIPAALAATAGDDPIVGIGIYDRPTIRQWGRGRVTLLGDAAHPMTPDAAQGASQALEDAVALAEALGETADVESALRRYEARREKRANAVVKQSRQAGRIAQISNPRVCRLRNRLLKGTPNALRWRQYKSVMEA